MAKTKHGLPETKGFFQLRGIVTGMNRDNVFKKQAYNSGSEKHTLNLAVKTDENSTVYTTIEGFKNEKVYLFKQSETKGERPLQKVVNWGQQYDFEDDGYFVIGTRLGIEKDENGKNILVTLTDYEAAEEIKNQLKDDTSVFIKGRIDYSSFVGRDGNKVKSKKLKIDSIFLTKDIDFESENFSPLSDFQQRIVFIGIEKIQNEDKFIVEAKIVTRDSIEDAEFVIYNKQLANTLKKNLKPYSAITTYGNIKCTLETEDVQEENVWGETNSFDKVSNPVNREYVITGAKPDTIDTETYTEEIIEEAITKIRREGLQANNNEDWGESNKTDLDDDDLPW